MRDDCRCECRVVNNRGADGNTWSQLFPLPLRLIHLLTYNEANMHVPTQCYLPSNSFVLPLTHAYLLLSPPGIFLLNNQFLSWLMWLKHTQRHTHTSARTRAHRRWLETGSIPLSVLLKEALTSFLALGQTHSYPSEKKRGRQKEGVRKGSTCREEKKRGAGSQVTCWPAASAFSILLPLLPELWASCGPLGWSSHLFFSSSSSHLSCTSPSCGCRGSWNHSEAWRKQDKALVRRREGWMVDINVWGERNRPKIFWTLVLIFQALVRKNRVMDFGPSLSHKK